KPFPRLPTVEAWDELPEEERAMAARDMEVYAAMVDYMDGQIKRVIDQLKTTGEYENTLIIFFSDNGANGSSVMQYPGQTEEYVSTFDNRLENRGLKNSLIDQGPGWAQASMTPSRMYKGFTAEGGIRSPLLVKLPGNMANAGSINQSFLHIRDIMPTILDTAGIKQPVERFAGRSVQPIQGNSVLPLLEGREAETGPSVNEVGYELFGMKAFIAGHWKALWMPAPNGTGEWELFDLKQDPAEAINLAKHMPEKVTELDELITKHLQETAALVPVRNTEFSGNPRTPRSNPKKSVIRPKSYSLPLSEFVVETDKGNRRFQLIDQDGKPCKSAALVIKGSEWIQLKNLEEGNVEISWDRSLKMADATVLFGWSGGTTAHEMNDWTMDPFELVIR
ncbi:MAG: sulfatase-like hydrolase/transferase, partial [Bacteroidales bacterium]|nr:sulfatase-like hydrolase/transferase [Bacteroidales bacterium]